MSSSLSFGELAALYANRARPAASLVDSSGLKFVSSNLPGANTKQKLEKLFAIRQGGQAPARPAAWTADQEQCTIAICCVIVDTLHHEEVWKAWLDSANGSKYSAKLFIHAKSPQSVQSEWVRARLIDVTFNPQWNSVEVAQAMLSTLDAAFQHNVRDTGSSGSANDNEAVCGRFVFCTETCVPLRSLAEVGAALFERDCSWLNAYHTPIDKYDGAAAFGAVDKDIVPPKAVWKSLPGWIALNRRHTAEVLALTNLLGGWGQPEGKAGAGGGEGQQVATGRRVRYRGTQGVRWREAGEAGANEGAKCIAAGDREAGKEGIQVTGKQGEHGTKDGGGPPLAVVGPELPTGTTAAAVTATDHSPGGGKSALVTAVPTATLAASDWDSNSDASLLEAWATVHAPEEVFFATALALLGYLRDPPATATAGATATGASAEVRIVAVNSAEWARRGDAHPIQHSEFGADLVRRMTAQGALFGRKFSPGSVSAQQWRTVLSHVKQGGGPRDTLQDEGSAGCKRERRGDREGCDSRDSDHQQRYSHQGYSSSGRGGYSGYSGYSEYSGYSGGDQGGHRGYGGGRSDRWRAGDVGRHHEHSEGCGHYPRSHDRDTEHRRAGYERDRSEGDSQASKRHRH